MKAKVKLTIFGLLKNGNLVNPAGEVIQEIKHPLVMSGEGGFTTETELTAITGLTPDQVADMVKKGWDGVSILVLMELDE